MQFLITVKLKKGQTIIDNMTAFYAQFSGLHSLDCQTQV